MLKSNDWWNIMKCPSYCSSIAKREVVEATKVKSWYYICRKYGGALGKSEIGGPIRLTMCVVQNRDIEELEDE